MDDLPQFPNLEVDAWDRYLVPQSSRIAFKQEVSTSKGPYHFKMYVYWFPSWTSFDILIVRVSTVTATVEHIRTIESHDEYEPDEVLYTLPLLASCLRTNGYLSSPTDVSIKVKNAFGSAMADYESPEPGDDWM